MKTKKAVPFPRGRQPKRTLRDLNFSLHFGVEA